MREDECAAGTPSSAAGRTWVFAEALPDVGLEELSGKGKSVNRSAEPGETMGSSGTCSRSVLSEFR